MEKPKIGMGVTYNCGSDRYPYTITTIFSEKKIGVKADDEKIVKGTSQDGSAEYIYLPNPKGSEIILTLRKDGRWRQQGADLSSFTYSVGSRRYYQDPHF